MKKKIYGLGWVGRSMKAMFPDSWVHDPGLGLVEERTADIAFVCVPTPLSRNGSLDTSIVEKVISTSKEDLILLRSTVMPGTCNKFPERNIVFQPEYLGETTAHPFSDPSIRPFMILGGAPENRAIAFKVAQCQELYDACQKIGLDYNLIREAVYGDDPRFNLWWTFVYPERRGFNSKCIPKDVYGWMAWAESLGANTDLTRAMLEVNERYLRKSNLMKEYVNA